MKLAEINCKNILLFCLFCLAFTCEAVAAGTDAIWRGLQKEQNTELQSPVFDLLDYCMPEMVLTKANKIKFDALFVLNTVLQNVWIAELAGIRKDLLSLLMAALISLTRTGNRRRSHFESKD